MNRTLDVYLAHSNAATTTYQSTRAEARRLAVTAGMEALAAASHAIELLRGLPEYDINPCVNHDSVIAANQLSVMVERMMVSIRNNSGRIR